MTFSYFDPGSGAVLPAATALASNLPPALASLGVSASLGGFPKLSAGLTRVRNRSGRARVLFVGTSVTRSWGCGFAVGPGTGTLPQPGTTNRSGALTTQIANLLSAAGIPCRYDAFFGSGNVSAGTPATDIPAEYDGGLTLGAGWGVSTGAFTIGGRTISNTADTTSLVHTPMMAADTFEIYHIPGAQFTVSDASGVLATINQGAFAVTKSIVTRAVASTLPISIQKVATANTLQICGIIPSCSFAPMLEIINGGAGGSRASDWINGASATFGLVAADLISLEMGGNDTAGNVPVATFQANFLKIAQDAAAVADTIMAKYNRTGPAYNASADYLAAMDAIAASVGSKLTVDYNALSANFTGADYFEAAPNNTHLSAQGYGKEAALWSSLVLAKA